MRMIRDILVRIRVNSEERKKIKAAAEKMGVPMSTYIRIKVLEAARNE